MDLPSAQSLQRACRWDLVTPASYDPVPTLCPYTLSLHPGPWWCRYYTGEGWVPRKMDVLVAAPEGLSLEHLRAAGLQPGASPPWTSAKIRVVAIAIVRSHRFETRFDKWVRALERRGWSTWSRLETAGAQIFIA